ncbi:hypothetical protein [Dolichospermum sp. UHCC 0259]|uniref:hypothetical protein n=1 Tax=Dolichospermum sp. UHCC 0259 TaxID=2590010 RepID=UPI0014465DBB|nr:hypothetical protein [Dolichospermum sp. UHCC 0259]MTJ51129.1 hypothetical protein [Dolichospermum sp. UHCC 0259]
MAQKADLQPLHVEISNSEVSANLEVSVTLDLRLINPASSRQYLTVTDISKILYKETGEKWKYQRVIETLAKMEYITKLKDNWQWQPTEKAKQFADFTNGVLKWSPEVINLILQQTPQQLRLAV